MSKKITSSIPPHLIRFAKEAVKSGIPRQAWFDMRPESSSACNAAWSYAIENQARDEILEAVLRGETVRNIFTCEPCPRCRKTDLHGSFHTCHDLREPGEAPAGRSPGIWWEPVLVLGEIEFE